MRITILIVLLFLSAILQAEETKEYVGLVYPPMPSGLLEKGGSLVKGDASANGLWYAHVEGDGKHMIWLIREIGRIVEGRKNRAVWRVEDTLLLPTVRKGERVHYGYDVECSFKGNPDTSIIAVGEWTWRKNQVGGYAHDIRLAWRIHSVLKKFEAISPGEVSCELNEDRD